MSERFRLARRDFLPLADAALLAYTANFGRLLKDNPEAYGVPDALAADYAVKQSLFAQRLQTAVDPETQGRRTVFLKNEAKTSLVEATRQIARQIGNTLTVTNDQRQALGLPVRSDTKNAIPVPRARPILKAKAVNGRTVVMELCQSANRRGKPEGVAGATIFTHVGATVPMAGEPWQFALAVTRSSFELPFGPSETGDTVWDTAFWTNAKGQSGPACEAVKVNLPAGGALPAEAGEAKPRMRMAA